MQVGDLVKHIEFGDLGIVLQHDENDDYYLICWGMTITTDPLWYYECELEVLCK